MKTITEREAKEEFSSKEVYEGEIRCIINPSDKTPYGFICNHNYHEDGFNTDIFFSFRCLDTQEKLNRDDHVSFKIAKNGNSGKVWAVNIRKVHPIGGENYG